MTLIGKFLEAAGGARHAMWRTYTQLVATGTDADLKALQETARELGRTPEQVQRDAAVLAEVARLRIVAGELEQRRVAYSEAMRR